jgi:hypothetical protein
MEEPFKRNVAFSGARGEAQGFFAPKSGRVIWMLCFGALWRIGFLGWGIKALEKITDKVSRVPYTGNMSA